VIATVKVMIRTTIHHHHLHKIPPKMILIDLVLKVFLAPVMVDMGIVIIAVEEDIGVRDAPSYEIKLIL